MPRARSASPALKKKKQQDDEMKIKTWGSGGLLANRELGSLVLILLCPSFILLMWYIFKVQGGSLLGTYQKIAGMGIKSFFVDELFPQTNPWKANSWKIIGAFMAFELFLMKFVPGQEFKATQTKTGHVPVYTANGPACYFISIFALLFLKFSGIWNPAIVYHEMGNLLASILVFALLFCVGLSFKGIHFPSTKDCGSNGSLIVDYFWGTELYPRVFGFDVKQFTNCRFGMIYWQLGPLCYAFAQYDQLGHIDSALVVSIIVQSIYIFKFFWWETGYFCSMDIQHDRAGYYICFGCLCWVPSIYTFHTFYLVENPLYPSELVTALMIIGGVLCVWINYDCDKQRQEFRATNGKSKIWGGEAEYIVAHYKTESGEARNSLLLTNGWWGLARHIHYIPEILASVFWCVPFQLDHPIAFFYPAYLTILLVDRAWRDDARCADKYGKYWGEYCEKVPHKIVPGIV